MPLLIYLKASSREVGLLSHRKCTPSAFFTRNCQIVLRNCPNLHSPAEAEISDFPISWLILYIIRFLIIYANLMEEIWYSLVQIDSWIDSDFPSVVHCHRASNAANEGYTICITVIFRWLNFAVFNIFLYFWHYTIYQNVIRFWYFNSFWSKLEILLEFVPL